jgi:hypothetical protein
MPRPASEFVTFAGLELSVSEWAALLGINAGTLHGRFGRGMTAAEAICTPIGAPVAPRKSAEKRRRQRAQWHRDRDA